MRFLFIIATLILVSFSAFAVEYAPTINVNGNERVETSTIVSFVNITDEREISQTKVDAALKKLFATGLFADVSINIDESTGAVNVYVVENPIISEISFEGNNRISKDSIQKELTLKPRAVYNKADLQHDVNRILTLYQKNSRFSTVVIPKVIQLKQNRVNLVFEINEGINSKISKISFVGNKRFKKRKLSTVIQTRETRWYRFFSSNDTFDQDRLELDKELLRRFYVARGYADFRVLSAAAELTPERDAFFLTFTVEEGKQYSFGKMSAESTLPDLKDGSLNKLIKTVSGETFNATLIDKTIEEFTKYLGNLGYAFVNITPELDRNPDNSTIGIRYTVKEGPRVYIDKINISGNVRTLDEVVRREFRLAEGDPYNARKIKRSKQRVNNLGFFSSVEIKNMQGDAPDKVNIDVAVKEQSTGELSFGAGFSSTNGALGNVSIAERNLLGTGQNLKLNLSIGAVEQQVDLSFTEPYFMGKDFSAGFDIFKTKRDGTSSQTNRTFSNNTLGATIRGSYNITEHLKHSLKYSFRSDDITDINVNASTFIKLQEGKNTTSLVGHSLVLDQRDSKFNPTEGYYVRFNQDIAGFGGDARFFRNEVRSGYYIPVIKDDWIFKLTGNAGYIFGFGSKNIRISDRFFLGGNNMRGFATEGIGPRDERSRDPLGGNLYATSTAEVSFPLGLSDELGFSGSVFTDFGTLFEVDDKTTVNSDGSVSRVLSNSSPRASIGAGISWNSPVGPIRIDFAHAFMKESFDKTEVVKFSLRQKL